MGPAGEAARGWAAPMRAMHWATVVLLLGTTIAVWAIGAAATNVVTAALFHRFVRRDGVLAGMVPKTGRASRPPRPGAHAAAEGILR